MGVFLVLIDALLFFFFTIVAICAPLIDSQACLPAHLYPKVLVNLTSWYSSEFGDYLMVEKPNFFVGLVWLELLFAWPLSLLNLYAILGGRSWFRTTCLVYGVSTLTSMVLFSIYIFFPFLLFSFLNLFCAAVFRCMGKWGKVFCLLYHRSDPPKCLFGPGQGIWVPKVAILSEMLGSHRASDKLLMMHYPFLGFAVLAILRGLLPYSGKTTAAGRRSGLTKKKRV
ncbi:hypothetical protein RHSIM_Rhsim06G0160800 [Rhododendron simsii]|uniref:EXPERA domain-containing protein n=1 Tax=Rhododendron simsii TaxID=118357 RepID=A0A834LM00_RHOSS|nr:hypothetical protein RHSIM_Rhsim06G0160800 [Rhododendron simsii]